VTPEGEEVIKEKKENKKQNKNTQKKFVLNVVDLILTFYYKTAT